VVIQMISIQGGFKKITGLSPLDYKASIIRSCTDGYGCSRAAIESPDSIY